MGALTGWVRRTAMRRGILGGDRRWLSIWVLFGGAHLVRRIVASKEVVERIELKPGQTVVITDLGRPEVES
ncbi:MAG TPA: hypothetical protein VGJ03_02025 [Acidimicrobiales bacterium]|jgi:hypothetical protein